MNHSHLVSRSIAEIFLRYDIAELHVSLTHGLWRYENWGYPPVDASPGAELWAWFTASDRNLTDADVDAQWKSLCDTLSGLLCASLNFIDHTNTLRPEFSFRPQFAGGGGGDAATTKHIRYATLPREIVCTENLTPWKKLLPCSKQAGLISLLNYGYIHSTNYHSLGLSMRRLCDTTTDADCLQSYDLDIKQTVNLVFDKQIISENQDWSIRKLFGQGVSGSCYLANSSRIYLDVTAEQPDFVLTPEPMAVLTSKRGGSLTRLAEYDLKALSRNGMFNVAAVYKDRTGGHVQFAAPPPPIYARRFLLGVGQERGQIVTRITNTHWAPLNMILHENIPWFVPIYLHSLLIVPIVGGAAATPIEPAHIHYVPGKRRERAYQLEVAFQVPARTTVQVSIEFDYIFLKWLEYPPDANHGHYIGSAVISAQLPVARNYTAVPVDGFLLSDAWNASRPQYFVQLRTEALLISLPTPDFSMPYNVICLACTVVALAFGPIHNISTKKIFVPTASTSGDGQDAAAPKSLLGKLKSLVWPGKR